MLNGVAGLTTDNAGHPTNSTGSALEITAAGDFVSVIDAANGALDSVVATDQATVAFWLNGDEFVQPQNNWTFLADPGRQLGSHAPWSNSQIYFDVAGCCNANQRINATANPEDFAGEWNHLAYVKNGPVTTIYIDGEVFHSSHPYTDRDGIDQPGQGGDKLPLGAITSFSIGADGAGTNSHIGLFDDFAMWDVALSQGRIQDIVGGGDVVPPFVKGDFDLDEDVDVDDFGILAGNLGAHLDGGVNYEDGDINFSGTVDLNDFREFKGEFPGIVAAATGVPEPASIGLAILAVVGVLPLLRRRC